MHAAIFFNVAQTFDLSPPSSLLYSLFDARGKKKKKTTFLHFGGIRILNSDVVAFKVYACTGRGTYILAHVYLTATMALVKRHVSSSERLKLKISKECHF